MAQNILIIGLKPHNSGKTSLARALVSYLKEKKHTVCGFKPFSGNNIWYDFDIIDHTLSEGRIYGKDVFLLKQESDIHTAEEILNPIHRIWNEPATIDPVTHLPNFIVDRITLQDTETHNSMLLINQNTVQQLPEKYIKKLSETSYIKHTIQDVATLNKHTATYYKKAVIQNYQTIQNQFDYIVIESYADQALFTWKGIPHFDAVIAIEPWQITFYDPVQYEKALQLSTQISTWEVSTQKIVELLKPERKIALALKASITIIPYLKKNISHVIDL
jgi:predicted P-loop ATPase/GTPase